MQNVLFVTHKDQACGVYQYGYNTIRTLERSTKYNFIHAQCTHVGELLEFISQYSPIAVIYNYHVSPLGWINGCTNSLSGIKQLLIQHEPDQSLPSNINAVISQNPIETEGPGKFKVSRILHEYSGEIKFNDVLTIGTFGFGFGGKGYDRLVSRVCDEFDEAHIRMHIPFAHFGDQSGVYAQDWAARARSQVRKPGIQLFIDHEWFTTQQLLDFLAANDLNFFMYDDMARGISSVLDFALSVKRPLAITGSTMFKHLWSQAPELLIEHNSLKDIIARGIDPLKPFYEQWAPAKLIEDYERIITTVCL